MRPNMERNLTILVAEDDENYGIILRKALDEIGRPNPVHILQDGEEVIRYLEGTGKYADRSVFQFPAVMLLDLKMPRNGGFEVLEWLRSHPECPVVPVLVLSSSDVEKDVEKAYRLGAHGYLAKPARYEDLKAMLNDTYRFWSWCVKPRVPKMGG